MKQALKYLTGALLAAAMSAGQAYNVGPATTYSNLNWSVAFNATGLVNCNRLTLDATGDLVNSDALVIYGTLSCGSGGYGMTGNLFINTDGSLNVYMAAAGYSIYCPRVSNWYGTCTVYDINGYQIGTGSMQLL